MFYVDGVLFSSILLNNPVGLFFQWIEKKINDESKLGRTRRDERMSNCDLAYMQFDMRRVVAYDGQRLPYDQCRSKR